MVGTIERNGPVGRIKCGQFLDSKNRVASQEGLCCMECVTK